jgi:hypothetical protein
MNNPEIGYYIFSVLGVLAILTMIIFARKQFEKVILFVFDEMADKWVTLTKSLKRRKGKPSS